MVAQEFLQPADAAAVDVVAQPADQRTARVVLGQPLLDSLPFVSHGSRFVPTTPQCFQEGGAANPQLPPTYTQFQQTEQRRQQDDALGFVGQGLGGRQGILQHLEPAAKGGFLQGLGGLAPGLRAQDRGCKPIAGQLRKNLQFSLALQGQFVETTDANQDTILVVRPRQSVSWYKGSATPWVQAQLPLMRIRMV